MSNPPVLPGGNLTSKLNELSTEVEQYIATVNNKLDNITALQGVTNTALGAIAAALAALVPILQSAADCACAAAAALDDAPWNEEPPPDPVYCDDPTADPATLTYTDYTGTGTPFWYDAGNAPAQYQADWLQMPAPPAATFPESGAIQLNQAGWYRFGYQLSAAADSMTIYAAGNVQTFTILVTTNVAGVDYKYIDDDSLYMNVFLDRTVPPPGEGLQPVDDTVITIGYCAGDFSPA